jgi:hypothetical protein
VRSRDRHGTYRTRFETLEDRLLLRGSHFADSHFDRVHRLRGDPHWHFTDEGTLVAGHSEPPGGDTTPSGSSPLSSIPELNSLPGARASIFLDFDGHFEAQWGSFSDITTPAFDQDGDTTTFSDAEMTAIQQIWRYVAEDYAPFRINVTTVQPSSFANGVALRVAIGGNGAWTGGTYGGVAYVNSFTNSIGNTVYVFPKNLGNGNAKYTGEASSHEAGHGFGLDHQSRWNGNTLVQEYYSGPGDGRAPIMGNSYSATRGVWWSGTSSMGPTSMQDDMAVIARSQNGFRYRVDDHGNTANSATPIVTEGSQLSVAGIITNTSDVDYFTFTTAAGSITLNVNVPDSVNNLDAVLQLRDAGDNLIAVADPSTSFGAMITATVAAGSYRLVVASHGTYGDVGQYTITGSVVAPSDVVNAPTGLVAVEASSGSVNLSWLDNSSNEDGFRIQRSSNGGKSWTQIAQVGSNVTAYSDATVHRRKTYSYRIVAFNAGGQSAYSNVAVVSL